MNRPVIRLLIGSLAAAMLLVGTVGCGSEPSPTEKPPDSPKPDTKQQPKKQGLKKVNP